MNKTRLEIKFDNQEIDGFSLADFFLEVDGTIFTTEIDCKYKLMIFLTLADLMDGLLKIYLSNKKEYILLNISSSFYLKFKKKKDDIVVSDNFKEAKCSFINFLVILCQEMKRVYILTENLNDGGVDDFKDSYISFYSFLKNEKIIS